MPSYYAEFKHFNVFSKQVDLIAQTITSYLKDKGIESNRNFRFLDIGANDGELTDKVVDILRGFGKMPDVTALEPDKETYRKLKHKPYNLVKSRLEDWLAIENSTTFDLVLCSHILYHIPEEKWGEITDGLRRRLNNNGNLMVVLDSDDSSIYRFGNSLKLPTQIRDFGKLVFAQDYQRRLEEKNIPYDQRTINSLMEIPSYEEMISILAFLYRTQQAEIEKNADKVKEFMNKFKIKHTSVFDWRQEMFIVSTPNPS